MKLQQLFETVRDQHELDQLTDILYDVFLQKINIYTNAYDEFEKIRFDKTMDDSDKKSMFDKSQSLLNLGTLDQYIPSVLSNLRSVIGAVQVFIHNGEPGNLCVYNKNTNSFHVNVHASDMKQRFKSFISQQLRLAYQFNLYHNKIDAITSPNKGTYRQEQLPPRDAYKSQQVNISSNVSRAMTIIRNEIIDKNITHLSNQDKQTLIIKAMDVSGLLHIFKSNNNASKGEFMSVDDNNMDGIRKQQLRTRPEHAPNDSIEYRKIFNKILNYTNSVLEQRNK